MILFSTRPVLGAGLCGSGVLFQSDSIGSLSCLFLWLFPTSELCVHFQRTQQHGSRSTTDTNAQDLVCDRWMISFFLSLALLFLARLLRSFGFAPAPATRRAPLSLGNISRPLISSFPATSKKPQETSRNTGHRTLLLPATPLPFALSVLLPGWRRRRGKEGPASSWVLCLAQTIGVS